MGVMLPGGYYFVFVWCCNIDIDVYLVGGVEHEFYFSIYLEKSFQLTFIFFGGVQTTNQV